MTWLLVFAAWLAVMFVWLKVSALSVLPMPLLSAAVAALAVGAVLGPLAAVMIALWAWRVPALVRVMRDASLQRKRRKEAYLLIVLVANGVAVDKPIWTTMRDAMAKLPPTIGAEVRLIVATSRVRADYDPAEALRQLGERWGVAELVILGQIAQVSTDTLGSGAIGAFNDLLRQVQARSEREVELRKGLTSLTITGVAMLGIFVLVLLGMLAFTSTRTMLVDSGLGHVVAGVAFLFVVGGLYLAETVWRRQERAANAAI
ncbi:MAG: hypothetical protein M0Z66_02150 [Thermaerobacter sp.]|nr:hypothetical protein [Thermaerobacter sp.]